MTTIPPSELPLRTNHIDQKIDGDVTGLRASIHAHVDYTGEERGSRVVTGIRFSEKGKNGSGLDKVLSALGDVLTAIFREEINAPEPEGLHVVANDQGPKT